MWGSPKRESPKIDIFGHASPEKTGIDHTPGGSDTPDGQDCGHGQQSDDGMSGEQGDEKCLWSCTNMAFTGASLPAVASIPAAAGIFAVNSIPAVAGIPPLLRILRVFTEKI